VSRAEDLKEGEMQAFDVQDTKVAVANVAGTFYALAAFGFGGGPWDREDRKTREMMDKE